MKKYVRKKQSINIVMASFARRNENICIFNNQIPLWMRSYDQGLESSI